MEDTHANITDPRTSYFAFFEFERDGLGFGIDALDDPGAWSKPCVAHCNIDPIVSQFRNFKESPQLEALHFGIPFLVDKSADAGNSCCVIAELRPVLEGHFAFEGIRELLVRKLP